MTRYAAGQLVWAFVITAVGAVKVARLWVDTPAHATTRWVGLS